MSIRIGIIGAGTIGKAHAAAAVEAGQVVATVADVDLAIAETLASEIEGATASAAVDSLLSDPGLDAVYICVPNRWHKQQAIAALEAGKDVFLEKPMGLNAQECREINAVSANSDRILQIGMAYRYSAATQSAKSIVESGDLGEVYHTKAHLYRQRGVPGLGGWFTTKAMSGGGPLIDLGVHLIDLVGWITGFPRAERVSGKVYSHFGRRMANYVYEDMWAGPPRLDGVCDVEDSAHALVHFAGGATLDLQVSWAINLPTTNMPDNGIIALCGDQGGLSFDLCGESVNLVTESNGRNVDSQVLLPEVDQLVEQATEFAKCVETRAKPQATGEQGEQVQTIIDAIYESSESCQEVALPLEG